MTIEQIKVPQAAAATAPAAPQRLRGDMGVGELVMSVLAFSAPLTTVAGFIPVLLLFSGSSAPAIYLAVTALLLVFSVGFVAMGRTVPNPGGFYAFITAGLGRSAGLGSALLATAGYMAIGFFAPSMFAITAKGFLEPLGFPEIPWYVYGLGIIAVTTALAYRRIDLSAKVLTLVMGLEVIAVVVFDVASFVNGGPADSGGAGFTLPAISDNALGLAVLFVLGNFLGFEATVIYREEAKDAEKTIPRAMFIAVAGIGVFYALAAWAYLAFLGADKAQAAAEADTAGLFNSAMLTLTGRVVSDIITVLLITSILASMLSIQNASARYLFSLGTDGVLPEKLGRVHPSHRSPFMAASFVGAVWTVLLVAFAVIGTSPDSLYAKAAGAGNLAIILVMFLASLAVVAYFYKRRAVTTLSKWKTVVAPVVASVGLGIVAYLAVANYSDLLGDTGTVTTVFLAITFGIPIVGFLYARVLRGQNPDVYQRIGRQEF
ncbi:APC family permease [Gordonia sp. YY1]|uniref:APC family permease n=1 Tax=Gordonia sp. YY1 TaxID=396712 RepID=UPI0013ACDD10|nr:APC family permease [Gordonia sp. YY1]KAF0970950.1 Putrescine importer PuuP [Gordonia sp. YY1]